MKIAHVINSLNRGGAESHLLELVTAQVNSGLVVDVIVIGEDIPEILSINKELSNVCRKIYRLKGPRMFNVFSYIKLQKIIITNIITVTILRSQIKKMSNIYHGMNLIVCST